MFQSEYQPGVGIPITRANVARLNAALAAEARERGTIYTPATAADVIRAFRPPYMHKHDLETDRPTRHWLRASRTVASVNRKAV